MNTFQLECFLAVANHLNFANAAEQMNISQPAITYQIQSLENELTVKLFHRSTRSVELTMEGQVFWGDAKNIVLMSQAAINRFVSADQQEFLDLSIGCYAFTGLQRYVSVFHRLADKYENLHPRISSFPDSQLLKQVSDGFLDVALKIKHEDKRNTSLQYTELKKVSPLCIMSPDHPLASSDTLSISDLKSEKIILYEPSQAGVAITQLQWKLAKGKRPSDLYFCESLESALLLAESGFGISVLPETFYLFQEMNLKGVPLEGLDYLSFGMYYKNYREKPYLKDFIDYMKEASNASI